MIGCTALSEGVLGETALPWFWVVGAGGDFSLLCYVCKANENQPKHDCRSIGRDHGSRFSVWFGLCGELLTELEVVGVCHKVAGTLTWGGGGSCMALCFG